MTQILTQRGYTTPERARAFLDSGHYVPTPPDVLPDLVIAAELLIRAIQAGERILIWGDFDVDGQTATALLLDGLRGLGADVAFYIPHRLRESHGIRLDSLAMQLDTVRPGLLLTCDTGVSAHEAVDYTKSRDVTPIITDHHDLPPELPDAAAVVNPKRLPADHALASLPGVGVAYKLMQYLYTYAAPERGGDLPHLLDLVALGIVADVATQTNDTRYLLQLGLDRLRHTERIGLRALIEIAELDSNRLNATDIGFQLGPRLNAAGRLDDARPVVELLTTTDPTQAHVLALQLEGLNNQRRLQNRQIYAAAQEQIARDSTLLDWEALVVAHPNWHAGILGIVASHLADRYQRPVVLLTTSPDGTARGSARSAPGYDIGAAIAAQADLLTHHGGHPGAAGLALPVDNIPAFRRRLSNTLKETRDPTVRPGLQLDAYLTLPDLTLDLVGELNRLAPFGEGNPRITLATRDLTLKSAAFIGRTQQHRRLIVEDADGNRQNVIWWNSADQPLPTGLFDFAYELEINTFRDETRLQLVMVDHRRSEHAPIEITPPAREIIDHRHDPDPAHLLSEIRAKHPDAAIWAEGYRRAESPGQPLSELTESQIFVIHTTPNSPQALQTALARVQPVQIVLLGINPPLTAFPDVLHRILELVKYVINQQAGQTTLTALAEAIAQSERTIRLALDYTAAQGEISVEYQRGGSLTITPAKPTQSPPAASDADDLFAALQAAIAETAAYRAYFHRAAPEHLLGTDQ
ncbi:MAG: single-stranded-DNA-specific exonuclease RecJ [Anaerolineae bacterium]|nr:single-stranded-DNA-specific exonuclease RecJ [Anaerolineae bacterium]